MDYVLPVAVRVLRTMALFLLLPLGALCASVFPAFAEPDPLASLAFDRLGHVVQLNDADASEMTCAAFGQRALTHQRYRNGGFGLGDTCLQI